MNSVVTDLWMGIAESVAMLRQFFNILKIFYSMFQKLFVGHKTQKNRNNLFAHPNILTKILRYIFLDKYVIILHAI